jgi:hypothetical protein
LNAGTALSPTFSNLFIFLVGAAAPNCCFAARLQIPDTKQLIEAQMISQKGAFVCFLFGRSKVSLLLKSRTIFKVQFERERRPTRVPIFFILRGEDK